MIPLTIRESWNVGDEDLFRETGLQYSEMMKLATKFDNKIIVIDSLDPRYPYCLSHNQYIIEFENHADAIEFKLTWL